MIQTTDVVFGFDVGTSSTKGVLVDGRGRILARRIREHGVSRPVPGQVETDAGSWWSEFVEIARELVATPGTRIVAVGVSGMGPCVAVADEAGVPLRPAILYGVDTRAVAQIAALDAELGVEAIVARGGSALSSQAVGPKLRWLAEQEPEVMARARLLLMPSSLVVHRLTGDYVLDHHSASQCSPLYDSTALEWYEPWFARIAPGIRRPRLLWPGEQAGQVTTEAASATGLAAGIPVIAGTIDAWTEAVSVGAHRPGDLMLMYGTTMFLVATSAERVTSSALWGTVGVVPGTYALAGGMASSGAITSWLRELTGADFASLTDEARASGLGARGLLMLPYFAGERTPVADPEARGTILGLTLEHGRGDLYRAALEATAFGVRHNVEAMRAQGADIRRVVAVGGGTQGGLWTRIVSDVTGLEQVIPTTTVGASYGAAFLAAGLVGTASIDEWNPPAELLRPEPAAHTAYSRRYELYRELAASTADLTHRLVALA